MFQNVIVSQLFVSNVSHWWRCYEFILGIQTVRLFFSLAAICRLLIQVIPTPTLDTSIPAVNDMDLPIAQHKGIRSCTQYSISIFVSYNNFPLSYRTFISYMSSVSTLKCPRSTQMPKWREAMQKEIKVLHKNNKWDLVGLPKGKKVVGC